MKRDMDLIREILIYIEDQPPGVIHQISCPERYDPATVVGHLRLIDQAALLDGTVHFGNSPGSFMMAIHGLSNKGHDFLEAIRNETVWSQTKEKIQSVGGGMAIDAVKAVATHFLNNLLGIGG